MMKKHIDQVIGFVVLVLIAVVARLWFRDIPNFAPVAAVALFAGYVFRSGVLATTVPLTILLITDQIIGGYEPMVMFAVYGSLTAPVLLRPMLRRHLRLDGSRSPVGEVSALVVCALCASVLFFGVTNLAVWATWYKAQPDMLVPCFIQAVPFFRFTMFGDLCFASILFGGYAFVAHTVRQRKNVLASTSA
ncbi:MAG: hypothetical protein KDB27_05520 [Planctomycetales bacterium]|nr:hypothetical protein [Planctomycetales bacterium]